MPGLAEKKCVPCKGGSSRLDKKQAQNYLKSVSDWELPDIEPLRIERKFKFKDFLKAMKFVNSVAEVAEDQGHHPDIHIYYNQVTLDLYTHAIDGLHENDFIMAAKINELLQ